jgi:hypothetical protein
MIDRHVHAGPDVRPRKLDAVALARAAKAAGMRPPLSKSHHTITAGLAQVVEGVVGGTRVFGGVNLNGWVTGVSWRGITPSDPLHRSAFKVQGHGR